VTLLKGTPGTMNATGSLAHHPQHCCGHWRAPTMRLRSASTPHCGESKASLMPFCPLQAQSHSQHWELGFIVFQAACCSAPHRDSRSYYSINKPVFLPHTPTLLPSRAVLSQLSLELWAAVGLHGGNEWGMEAAPGPTPTFCYNQNKS
jgi:hypothetical protein